jgi:hypothetical protein
MQKILYLCLVALLFSAPTSLAGTGDESSHAELSTIEEQNEISACTDLSSMAGPVEVCFNGEGEVTEFQTPIEMTTGDIRDCRGTSDDPVSECTYIFEGDLLAGFDGNVKTIVDLAGSVHLWNDKVCAGAGAAGIGEAYCQHYRSDEG